MNQISNSNPTVFARETLRRLALLKIPPTPDNYHKIYDEISGGSSVNMNSTASISMEQSKSQDKNLEDLINWGETLKILLKQLENKHGALTIVQKREGINRVLTKFSKDSIQLHLKLRALVDSWGNSAAPSPQVLEKSREDQPTKDSSAKKPRNDTKTQQIQPSSNIPLQEGLLKLLNMLMDSTGGLLSEDQWIGGQFGKLRETISRPLDLSVIEQAEQNLKEIAARQDLIGMNLSEAKRTLKQMVTFIITNIEELSDTAGGYQEKLESYAEKISKTEDINELNQLLGEIMTETKQMQKNALNYRNDLLAARVEVNLAQDKINRLEIELQQIGEKVHEDHLTGVLNRRGLDQAFGRETARSVRHRIPLCYALLDIDNFKQLNDAYGHTVGDDALVYLVDAVKETTRPEDIVSRYGGEEFVILLPKTTLDEAVQILSRIRRNLTKKFFLHENKRLLITFSAGVAQFQPGETPESIFKRADEALYRAKKGGKNQILTSE